MDANQLEQAQQAEVGIVQNKFPNLHFICQFDMDVPLFAIGWWSHNTIDQLPVSLIPTRT